VDEAEPASTAVEDVPEVRTEITALDLCPPAARIEADLLAQHLAGARRQHAEAKIAFHAQRAGIKGLPHGNQLKEAVRETAAALEFFERLAREGIAEPLGGGVLYLPGPEDLDAG